jgi:hypothetical protein
MIILLRTAPDDEVPTAILVTSNKQIGVTEKFRRASGLPQGGTHSCALWNGFIDIMAEMQHEMAKE